MFTLVRENSTVAVKAVAITQYLQEIDSVYAFYALSESLDVFVTDEFHGEDMCAAQLHIMKTFELMAEYEIFLKSKIVRLIDSIN